MMDKQKQIEEINNIISEEYNNGNDCWWSVAEEVYNAGYRKIPENAVVLTIPEKERLLRSALSFDQTTMECLAKEVRKETAEKFKKLLKAKLTDIIPFEDYEVADWNYDGMDIENSIDEICKEITEGKV